MATTAGVLVISCVLLAARVALFVRRRRVAEQRRELSAAPTTQWRSVEPSHTPANDYPTEGDETSHGSLDEGPAPSSQNAVSTVVPASVTAPNSADTNETSGKPSGNTPARASAAYTTRPEDGDSNTAADWAEDDLDFIETRAFERRGDDGFMPLQPVANAEAQVQEAVGEAAPLTQSGAIAASSHSTHGSLISETDNTPPNSPSVQTPFEPEDVDQAAATKTISTVQIPSIKPNDHRLGGTQTFPRNSWRPGKNSPGAEVEQPESPSLTSPEDDSKPNGHGNLTGQFSLFDDVGPDDSDSVHDRTEAVLQQHSEDDSVPHSESYADWQDDESLLDGETLDDIEANDLEVDSDALDELLDELPVSDEPDESEPPLFDIDSSGDSLGQYGKAERLALLALQRFDPDQDVAWPILLDIFLESPWPRTQKSIEALLRAGTTCEALELAVELRRLWLSHPEFAMSASVRTIRGERWQYSPQALSRLSWPRAARLADAWSAYPDAAEIEHLMESLHERWRGGAVRQRAFPSFQLYVGYVFGDVKGALVEWPEFSFDVDSEMQDPFDQLEHPDCWPYYRDALYDYGIDRPFVTRPVSQARVIAVP